MTLTLTRVGSLLAGPWDCTQMTPLTAPRDALPNGRVIHALVLTYTLQLRDKATVTPRLEGINRQVYDGEFEAQMYGTGPLTPPRSRPGRSCVRTRHPENAVCGTRTQQRQEAESRPAIAASR
jgi:hypothetical protein